MNAGRQASARSRTWALERATFLELDPREISPETIRPIRREEYERMVMMGLFADERMTIAEILGEG